VMSHAISDRCVAPYATRIVRSGRLPLVIAARVEHQVAQKLSLDRDHADVAIGDEEHDLLTDP